ncbi:hypothetical protein HNQ79_005040 [Streptomyces candidus]|uniref:Uncharacterized protein n=1 Tax=Streptomyces candidus TaxID=67283 RepID=A0A7X0HJB7_9ACTN|nr:hypothetical protein [Streptomyces candidus]
MTTTARPPGRAVRAKAGKRSERENGNNEGIT